NEPEWTSCLDQSVKSGSGSTNARPLRASPACTEPDEWPGRTGRVRSRADGSPSSPSIGGGGAKPVGTGGSGGGSSRRGAGGGNGSAGSRCRSGGSDSFLAGVWRGGPPGATASIKSAIGAVLQPAKVRNRPGIHRRIGPS